MTTQKILAFACLVLLMFPLRPADLLIRAVDECKCDLNELGCKIVCSGIGSGRGTGGGTSTFEVAPRDDLPPQERPIVVPRTDTKSPVPPMKQ